MVPWKTIWKRVRRDLGEAFFPTRCFVCQEIFPRPRDSDFPISDIRHIRFEDAMKPYLCRDCMRDAFSPAKTPVVGDKSNPPKPFRIARSVGIYEKEEGVFAKAIRCFKYDGKLPLAQPFGMLLFSGFVRHWEEGAVDMVAAVPLHIRRLRKRGFNQSYLLIRKWPRLARDFDMDLSGVRIEWDALVRNKDTIPQARLKGKARTENIKNAFGVKSPSKIRGKRILLVDDIYTTGSTVSECAKELMKNGAEHVDVLTLARTGK